MSSVHHSTSDMSNLIDKVRLQATQQMPDLESNEGDLLTNPWPISSFLRDSNYDPDEAAKRLLRFVEYHRTRKTAELSDANFPLEYHQIGHTFTYRCDRSGFVTIYFRTKFYYDAGPTKKNIEDWILFTFRKAFEASQGHGVALICDFTSAGLSNFDWKIFYFMVTMYLNYSPYDGRYAILYNLPRIFSFLLKLLRSVLPSSMSSLIRVVDCHEGLCNYIEPSQLPPFLGGTCTQEYQRSPPECLSFEHHPVGLALVPKQRNYYQNILNKLVDRSRLGKI